jgi:NADH:ubiquinone oxidoreductase subunit 5 (subunit L)/multisubunit Na+/H+ antiporter MnhA subunit
MENNFSYIGTMELVLILIVVAVFLTVYIFYLLTLQNVLKAISPENRRTSPANVWLMLIPLVHFIWCFFLVGFIADSLKAEFDKRGISAPAPRPGFGIGLAMAICNICALIPFIGALPGIGGFVLWIIYWVKMTEFKAKLTGTPSPVV